MADDGGDREEAKQPVIPAGEKDRRRKPREETAGYILWSYASDPVFPEYEGELLDVNRLGVGFISDKPLREASVLRIRAKGLWQGCRYATVMLCNKVEDNIFRNGVIFN